jgi:hypothetical protein
MANSIPRIVRNNLLTSPAAPAVRIQVHPAFTYAGGHEFILYGVARAEQHLFVSAGPDRQVQRLVWVQFEAYLEDNAHIYDYGSSQLIEISGLPFYYDAGWTDRAQNTRARPDSDGARMAAFLQDQGYRLEPLEILERYVTLSPDRRQELMLIYAENGGDLGLDLEALEAGGAQGELWISVQKGLHARGLASFAIFGSGLERTSSIWV